jgi:ElaB/YqjD/DUF883 family membrane-anchored ribosome-binding protein
LPINQANLEVAIMTSKAHTRDTAPDFDTLARDFSVMKHDIAALASKLKSDGSNGISDAMHDAASQLSDRASELYDNLAAQGKRGVKAVSDQVEEQPLMSLLVAFGVGFVAAKLISR